MEPKITLTIENVTPDLASEIMSVVNGAPVIDLEKPPKPVLTDEERQALLDQSAGDDADNNNAGDPPPPPPADDELAKGLNGRMIPWDERIHAKSKKQNADGTWRLAQGIDREKFVPEVEAELVAAMEAAAPPPPPPGEDNQGDDTPARPTTFSELLPLVTKAKADGTLTDEDIAKACEELDLASFGLIATRADLVPEMAEKLGV